MSISNASELAGMKRVSEAVSITLREMRKHAKPGMSTKELDEFGGRMLQSFGARSAPYMTYKFPGWTCISVNHEVAHGIPSAHKILKEGDLVNIDVSAELGGFWSDNGGSFVLGNDLHQHQHLVNTSREILHKAIRTVRGGMRIADLGHLIETEARKAGYTVIKNLTGHGIGRSLHEAPQYIPNYRDRMNRGVFKTNSVVAIETFISTESTIAESLPDGWTLVGNRGGYVAQHEHTLMITDAEPIIFTSENEIWEN